MPLGALRRLRQFCSDAFLLGLLHRQGGLATLIGIAPTTHGTDLDAQQILQQLTGSLQRHPDGQSYQRFLPKRRQPRCIQSELLIEGEKFPARSPGRFHNCAQASPPLLRWFATSVSASLGRPVPSRISRRWDALPWAPNSTLQRRSSAPAPGSAGLVTGSCTHPPLLQSRASWLGVLVAPLGHP